MKRILLATSLMVMGAATPLWAQSDTSAGATAGAILKDIGAGMVQAVFTEAEKRVIEETLGTIEDATGVHIDPATGRVVIGDQVIETKARSDKDNDDEDGDKDKKHKSKDKGEKGHGKPKGLPPGLAKKGKLPPGLAKRETLPPGLAAKITPGTVLPHEAAQATYGLPKNLEDRLPPPPQNTERKVVGNDVVLIQAGTNLVLDVLKDVLVGN